MNSELLEQYEQRCLDYDLPLDIVNGSQIEKSDSSCTIHRIIKAERPLNRSKTTEKQRGIA